MRVYINNLNLDILGDIEKTLNQFFFNSKEYIDLYTDEGIYRVEGKDIFLLDPIDKDIKTYNKFYGDFTIIVDPSYFDQYLVNTVQGHTHLSLQTKQRIYKLNKQSNMGLVIKHLNNKPIDMYFEIERKNNLDIKIDDYKKEIIEFLSMLN